MTDVRALRQGTDPSHARARGALRRFAISLTAKVLWQLTGPTIDGVVEVLRAEPFTGIGFFARPPASGKPEAIVAMLGDADAPAVIAIRDEATRAAAAGELTADETAVFNSLAILHFKEDGTIEARPVGGGPAVSLALKSDLDAAKAVFDVHAHPGVTVGVGVTGATVTPFPSPVGTTTFKAS
jgi:hypothetical protein